MFWGDLSARGPRGPSTGAPATPVPGPMWVAPCGWPGGKSAPSLWTFLLTLVRFTMRGGSYQVFSLLLIKSLSNNSASSGEIPTGCRITY